MEKDFHYYLTYSLVKTTGYENADIIAYASQFVDDNNEGLYSIDEQRAVFPEKLPIKFGGYYYPIMTVPFPQVLKFVCSKVCLHTLSFPSRR